MLAVLLIISGIAHGYNMFHYPYYENDEGTYMSQAWSLLTQNKLAPYTYWYDHAPAGWILISLWIKLTGGFFTFGTSVNSGRVIMLLLHLGTTALLFYIAKRLTGRSLPGIIAVLIFSLSPLAIYFQRRVLLDNIMIFWVFLSLAMLLKEKLKLTNIITSAVFFGIAVLTKENAIFFTPAFVYVVYQKAHEHHKNFAIIKWLAVSGLIISFYFLYALLKGEFFPAGFLDQSSHVSLLTTLYDQSKRGSDYLFWNRNSDFYTNLLEWLSRDKFTVILGSIAVFINILLSLKKKSLRIPAFFTFLYFLFLISGKLVIDFYIIPLIPLLALNMGVLIDLAIKQISFKKQLIYNCLSLVFLLAISAYLVSFSMVQYTKDETTPQVNTIEWIKNNLASDSYIVIDDSIYLDLHEKRFSGDRIFPNADWAWKVEKDEMLKTKKYNNDWKRVEYIALSHEILRQMRLFKNNFIEKAFINSFPVVEWEKDSTSYFDIDKYLSTNGDWMSIYKVKDKESIALDDSWKFYKENFIISYGRVIDPSNYSTTSEGQSYAMLRAVWQNDKPVFDGVWAWTKDHFQYRIQDKLFSWLWIKDDEDYKLGDSASASDADEDIALTLLFAYKRWGEEKYLIEAKEIINDIWSQEVVLINGHYYLVSGSGASRDDGFLLNPSYFSPATYRIFAQVDENHPWNKLADDSYYLFNKIDKLNNNTMGLSPNWLLIDKETGLISSPGKYFQNKDDIDFYGFDAFRIMWRIAIDAIWFNEPQAYEYLKKVEPFYTKEWITNNNFSAVYSLDGTRKVPYSNISTNVGALSVFTITNKTLATEIFNKLFEKEYNYDLGYWKDKNNYYDQNWAWFGLALYSDNLPNLWEKGNK
ncbi:hypothetical protein A3F03_03640 [Candidatus Roizmanbacteria bacterium RIFCSPHIGHO2_12_FULL_41_11]|uniref:Glycosyltransferase RgtA/B/C/D-like domain-containing protein n=2 Tax=Candidatus Roizmaniibacteriota TaxID=1752723 RepID=A0A1F7I049_9BACT|nr:MAG: hypothetical protein A3F03_03640 [Candidatus Roizmanbacteria bacterium RIFCSPHIGHO2_12_FULL_41_11]